MPRLLLLAAIVLLAAFALASLVTRDPSFSESTASARCEVLGKGASYCLEGARAAAAPTADERCESFGRGGLVCSPVAGATRGADHASR